MRHMRAWRSAAQWIGCLCRMLAVLMPMAPMSAQAAPLTLEEALATAAAPHPQNRIAAANLAVAQADETLAASRNDLSVSFVGALSSGRPTVGPDRWSADNEGRLTLYKPLYDFGRTEHSVDAARQVVKAREEQLLDVREERRIAIMARFFEVLLADMRYTADNEYMAVAYVNWDDGRKRLEAGELSRAELARLENRYQEIKLRRDEDERQERLTRQRLADAMNQPGKLAADLARPKLADNNISLPGYEQLLPIALAHNRRLLALDAQVAAARQRIAAARADGNPRVDLEVSGGDFSRHTVSRNYASGGLVVTWPLYAGRQIDAQVARARAVEEKLLAQREALRRNVADALLDTLTEIAWLRASALPAAHQASQYRDLALERARAEYEMEYRTNLGNAMADIQAASLQQAETEYRLALALARLSALTGQPLARLAAGPEGEKP